MIENNTMIKVTNRDNGRIGYKIPDLNNLQRSFEYGETKEVSAEEIRKLSYQPGGMVMLKDYLLIHNQEMIDELIGDIELEYNYTEKDIATLLTNGTLDQLHDCLDFAPKGVINLVQKVAVDVKVNDIEKRKLIREKTGFNVSRAIEINEETLGEDFEGPETKTRRSSAPVETKERKVSNYEIIE